MNTKNNSSSDFFNDFFNEVFSTTKPIISDNIFTYEVDNTKDGSYIFCEVPGFNKSNLKVEMDEAMLYVAGRRTYKINNETKTKELSHRFNLKTKFDPNEVEVTIEDGLLTIFLPKFKIPDPPKRINLLK